MIDLVPAFILGLTQGVTEFLPVSSSGHLILLPYLFKFKDPGLAFDVLLHLATALALIAYFWKDLLALLGAFLKSLQDRKINTPEKRLSWLLFIGSTPAAIFGLLFEDTIEKYFRDPLLIACNLIIFAVVLVAAERLGKRKDEMKKIDLFKALCIGLAQVLALIPGVSRAGITMTAGLFCGLKREAAARFSFLLATPIVLAAAVFKVKELFGASPDLSSIFLWTGFLTAVLTGFLAIKFLLDFLKKHTFYGFAWYRIILGLFLIFLVLH